jgi:hypothetical protein
MAADKAEEGKGAESAAGSVVEESVAGEVEAAVAVDEAQDIMAVERCSTTRFIWRETI